MVHAAGDVVSATLSVPEPTPAELRQSLVGRILSANPLIFLAYACSCAFSIYLCMYAFRKAYDAAKYDGLYFLDTSINLKTAFVISQIIGYMCSKFLGSWICSSIHPARRALLLIGLITISEVALLFFAILPGDLKAVAMFCNGLPLGMVWGLVVLYLEGRRLSEILVMSLSCSYVIGGAVAKDVAKGYVIGQLGISEWWMPAVTGALFFVPFVLFTLLLNQLPPPNAMDVQSRSPRVPMNGKSRMEFVRTFGSGFILLLVAYFLLTAYRDFRDHYGIEMLTSLGLDKQDSIFVKTEKYSPFAILASFAILYLVRGHRAAIYAIYSLIIGGFAVIGIVTYLYEKQLIDGLTWITTIGIGLYLAYVPYGALLFERMVAVTRFVGTSVFAIQLADGVGYSGSVFIQLTRDILFGKSSRLDFFVPFTYVVSVVGIVTMLVSLWRLMITINRRRQTHVES